MNLPAISNAYYRWVIVASGGLLGCVAFGAMFSLPVFLVPIARNTGWSMTGVSSAMTIGFLAMAVGSIGWGNLSDRWGARPVVMIGAVVLATGLALTSLATSLIAFQLIFGLMVGGAAAAIFAPMMACVTGWFDTQRSLAVSLVSAGMGMAPMTMSPLAAWLISHHDWRTSVQIIAAIVAIVMIPVALLIRRPPTPASPPATVTPAEATPISLTPTDMSLKQVVRTPQFITLLLTNFFCCATHSGPIFHTVSYAVSCGIPMILAVSIYSLEGLAGLGGRVAFGVLGDRFGAKRILLTGLLLQSIGAFSYIFARDLISFYAVAAVFGFIYAGTMPLYAVLARENFPLKFMGTVIGGTAMAGSLGMATGPVAGGLIYDLLGSYGWLYMGASALGLGALLIAMTFRPVTKPEPEPAPLAPH